MDNIPVLQIAIDTDDVELYEIYSNKINIHNEMVRTSETPDSGFDLFIPKEETFIMDVNSSTYNVKIINLKIKGTMIENKKYVAYQIYPRSSISKTPLMLANHVGIIDSGYRGHLMVALRSFEDTVLLKHSRVVQVCHPSLKPFYVKIVNENDFSETSRGSGGFGSTGM